MVGWSMDFVDGLTMSHLYFVVFVVIVRLTKYTHFMALSHPYIAAKVANFYLHYVFKLHGMPQPLLVIEIQFLPHTFGRN